MGVLFYFQDLCQCSFMVYSTGTFHLFIRIMYFLFINFRAMKLLLSLWNSQRFLNTQPGHEKTLYFNTWSPCQWWTARSVLPTVGDEASWKSCPSRVQWCTAVAASTQASTTQFPPARVFQAHRHTASPPDPPHPAGAPRPIIRLLVSSASPQNWSWWNGSCVYWLHGFIGAL